MVKIWRRQLERAIEKQLTKSGAKQVRAAHDFGDLHGGVIDHNGELVGRNVVLPPDDKVAKFDSGNGPLQPRAPVEKLHCFAIRNAEPPVHTGRIVRLRNC